jgi:3-hydroxyisobutyrate dehydrogenase-like beta-hydroxyacid dehydrogenase
VTVGLIHPGEMGAAVGRALRDNGVEVLWASDGRSSATAERAAAAGLQDVGTVQAILSHADVVVSVVPPHAALDAAAAAADSFAGIYVDANAVSPDTARAIASPVSRFVDGGIVGPPPREPGTTRLYLSGAEAQAVAELFFGSALEAKVLSAQPGAASALKMAYAAWTKGSAALLLASLATAEANGVGEALLAEWRTSIPEAETRLGSASRSALTKGWRWIGEMEEIARTFASAELPSGFHEAAAEIYRRTPHEEPGAEDQERVVAALLAGG